MKLDLDTLKMVRGHIKQEIENTRDEYSSDLVEHPEYRRALLDTRCWLDQQIGTIVDETPIVSVWETPEVVAELREKLAQAEETARKLHEDAQVDPEDLHKPITI